MTSTAASRQPGIFNGEPVAEILVPVSMGYSDQRDVAIAAEYAQLWQVPMKVLHVELSDGADDPAAARAVAASIRTSHPDLPIEAVELSAESIAYGVSAAADEQSLVFIASDRSSQWLERGSVGEEILQSAHDVVMLCGPNCNEPPIGSSVVVPVDGSTRAEAALQPALAVAASTGAKLWIVTVVPSAVADTVASLRARGEAVSESGYLRALAETLAASGADVGWEVVHGDDPVDGVMSFVDKQGSSVIVAATHGETGVAKRLFGSVCLGLVESGSVPVVIVKTDETDPEPLLGGS